MATREDLEAELAASWNLQTLSIYADHLQSIGDPRGELIALDLGAERGSAYWDRRRALLDSWLGDALQISGWDNDGAHIGRDSRTVVTFEYGLCNLTSRGDAPEARAAVAEFFASPIAPYLRRLQLAARGETIAPAIDALVSARRGWLRELAIYRTDGLAGPSIGDASRLVEAAPHLELLDVNGSRRDGRVLAPFAHPRLARLRVTGANAIDLRACGPFPALREVDFAFGDEVLTYGLMDPASVPALCDVRFSRDEPGHRHLFGELDALRLPAQNLYLPSLRSEDDVRCVQRALDRMPQLRSVVIARAFSDRGRWGSELVHPTARIELPERLLPWPAPEANEDINFGGVDLSLALLVLHCEARYDGIQDDERRAWDEVWKVIRTATPERWSGTLSHSVLSKALDAGGPADDEEVASIQRIIRKWMHDPEEGSTLRVTRE